MVRYINMHMCVRVARWFFLFFLLSFLCRFFLRSFHLFCSFVRSFNSFIHTHVHTYTFYPICFPHKNFFFALWIIINLFFSITTNIDYPCLYPPTTAAAAESSHFGSIHLRVTQSYPPPKDSFVSFVSLQHPFFS